MTTRFEAGRRAGLQAAIAQLTARWQQLLGVYYATKIERICDIYDIRQQETERCLAIVNEVLETEMAEYTGPQASKCPLPRIGSKEWGWARVIGDEKPWFKSANTDYQISWYARKWCVVQGKGFDFSILFRSRSVSAAKRVAELLTRRDWRREMRGKK